MTVQCLVCADPVFGEPNGLSSAARPVPPPHRRLTATEEQIFAALHSAPSNEEIAACLHISPRTVKFHLGNIRAKLDGISRLRLCLLSALHHRGLRSLCQSCAPVFPRPAAASVAGAIPGVPGRPEGVAPLADAEPPREPAAS
ncbi:helix-turn-helix transcriptional regulator [Streptomyces sp. NPDC048462]|uniref:helix-turn-helix domain-containing protein n=1 Tax=Streptomyces sp. NPDC048462 TaxID=3365555 RepID=UPI00371AFA78